MTEELFGPVLTLVHAVDLDEAIAKVNASRYGKCLGDLHGVRRRGSRLSLRRRGWHGRRQRRGRGPDRLFPFSGWKDSIDGELHANGRDAVEFCTRKKVVTSRWAR